MRKARFNHEQMVAILREADREAPTVVAMRHKVSEQTIYKWRKKFCALGTDEVRRPKQLEIENGRLADVSAGKTGGASGRSVGIKLDAQMLQNA
jgi:putative transposase